MSEDQTERGRAIFERLRGGAARPPAAPPPPASPEPEKPQPEDPAPTAPSPPPDLPASAPAARESAEEPSEAADPASADEPDEQPEAPHEPAPEARVPPIPDATPADEPAIEHADEPVEAAPAPVPPLPEPVVALVQEQPATPPVPVVPAGAADVAPPPIEPPAPPQDVDDEPPAPGPELSSPEPDEPPAPAAHVPPTPPAASADVEPDEATSPTVPFADETPAPEPPLLRPAVAQPDPVLAQLVEELAPDRTPTGPDWVASTPERSVPDEIEVVPAPPAPEPVREPVARPDPTRFARPFPRVVAIANQKGGVGKTTTAVNLSAALAEQGFRVLVVDLDPQGNASTGLGIDIRALDATMYDVLLRDLPMDDCIEASEVRNLFVAPANLDLAGAEIELVPAFSRELKLRRALADVVDDYDFVFVDCPPSLGLLTVNSLAAATEVLVPIQCEYYALEGLGQLMRNVSLVQRNLNPDLELSVIVCVMYDARTKLAEQVVTEVRTHFGPTVCRTVVPRTVRLSEAPSYGQPILAFDPSSRGAIAYRELAKEVSGGTAPSRAG